MMESAKLVTAGWLARFHHGRHCDDEHRRAGEERYHALDRKHRRDGCEAESDHVGRHVDGMTGTSPDNRYVGFDIVGFFGFAILANLGGCRNGQRRLAFAVPTLTE